MSAMSEQRENYWPTDFGVPAEVTPLTVLKEQATFLGERTKNLIEGRVQTKVEGEAMKFRHSLYLVVPTLGNYRYFLLSVTHNPTIYPIEIFDATSERAIMARDFEEFKEKLREILSSDRVKRIVGSLLSYASPSFSVSASD
jgi:hypothetical protein